MKVLVCGGRNYNDHEFINKILNGIHKKHGITLIIEGGADGADENGGFWAVESGVQRCTYHANWDIHARKAGPIRNANMIKFGAPDVCIAFKGGKGTACMVDLARKAGVTVWEPRR